METRRERLYRIGNRAEARYHRRRWYLKVRPDERLINEADALVSRLVNARLPS